MEPLPLDHAVARLGINATVADLRARIRCRGCGRRTEDLRVVYVGPEDRPAEFRYRR
jgi:hypothetical protein